MLPVIMASYRYHRKSKYYSTAGYYRERYFLAGDTIHDLNSLIQEFKLYYACPAYKLALVSWDVSLVGAAFEPPSFMGTSEISKQPLYIPIEGATVGSVPLNLNRFDLRSITAESGYALSEYELNDLLTNHRELIDKPMEPYVYAVMGSAARKYLELKKKGDQK